jgi:hypothetical protein
MNRLTPEKRTQVILALVEGCSIRSTVRMTGVSKKTVMRLLIEAGAVASEYQDLMFRNLTCKRIQVDEMWAFIGANFCDQSEESRRWRYLVVGCD